MVGRTDHDRVDIAGEDLCGVANRFRAAELHLGTREKERLPAELAHADVKRHAGTGRRLLEDHRQHLAGERLVGRAGLGRQLPCERVIEDHPQVIGGDG